MKIALSGAAGSGKTTLAEKVSEKYNIPLIPEFAREIAKEMGIENLRKAHPDEIFAFQNKIVENKIREEDKQESFIADRCTADNLAYYLRWCSRDISDTMNETYTKICLKRLKEYDHIYILPWNKVPHKNDGFRSSKIYYIYEMHCLVLGILQDNNIPFDIITEESLEDRVELFRKVYEGTNDNN